MRALFCVGFMMAASLRSEAITLLVIILSETQMHACPKQHLRQLRLSPKSVDHPLRTGRKTAMQLNQDIKSLHTMHDERSAGTFRQLRLTDEPALLLLQGGATEPVQTALPYRHNLRTGRPTGNSLKQQIHVILRCPPGMDACGIETAGAQTKIPRKEECLTRKIDNSLSCRSVKTMGMKIETVHKKNQGTGS